MTTAGAAPRRVCFPYPGDSVGGSHLSSVLLIEALDRRRYEPHIVLHREGALADFLRERSLPYEVLPVPALAGEGADLWRIARAQVLCASPILRFLRRAAIDIVHTNDLRTHLSWAIPTRLAGRRLVWHQRMILSASPLWRLIPVVASRVPCISGAVQRSLPPSPKTEVIPNPAALVEEPTGRLRDALLQEVHGEASSLLVGFVGNMMAQKRPHIFLRAAAHVSAAHPSARFLLFGDDRGGELQAMHALAAELGIAGVVHFMGYRRPIEPWIGALDLLLAPGIGDAFGRTLVEAMMARTAVIAANSGGHAEIIHDGVTGLLVGPDDPAALAAAASDLLHRPERRAALALAARRHAEATYSPAAHAQRVVALYDTLF